ncbi:MAG: alpha-D-ribose 1-methylphosphonate 5-triphosphate diphosphatase [Janthinobacterium lividum]
MRPTLLRGATLVLADRVAPGTLAFAGGRITAVSPGDRPAPHAPDADTLDLDGDFLLPGLVDLHTDNLERQVEPRPGARWPSRAAMLAHDAQCAAAGVTTVLDALCLGEPGRDGARTRTFLDGLADGDALHDTGLLRAEHFLHLRCELPADGMPALLAPLARHPRLRMVSLMDHTPGHGQFTDLDRYRAMQRRDGLDDAATDRRISALLEQRDRLRAPNRRAVLDCLRDTPAALASHDDATEAEVVANHADGVTISEFPVAEPAARAAHALGMAVVAGAPNVVRGGSHSGNVAAAALIRAGLVDALASDYVPASLLDAAFRTAAAGLPLHDAVALVTRRPAALAGLDDRGRLAPGLRADLLRVRLHEGLPVVRAVWREGERVA